MVGDAKDLEPQLKKEGWRYEKVAFTDTISAGAEAAPAGPVDPKALAAAQQVVDEALAAKGGKQSSARVKSLHMTATGTTTIQGQTLPVEIEREFVLPDKMRIDATIAKQLQGHGRGRRQDRLGARARSEDRQARRSSTSAATTWPRRSSKRGARPS